MHSKDGHRRQEALPRDLQVAPHTQSGGKSSGGQGVPSQREPVRAAGREQVALPASCVSSGQESLKAFHRECGLRSALGKAGLELAWQA